MLVKAELNYNQNISPDTCLSLTRFQPECLQYLESELLLGGGIDNKMDLTLGSFLLVFCHSSSATIWKGIYYLLQVCTPNMEPRKSQIIHSGLQITFCTGAYVFRLPRKQVQHCQVKETAFLGWRRGPWVWWKVSHRGNWGHMFLGLWNWWMWGPGLLKFPAVALGQLSFCLCLACLQGLLGAAGSVRSDQCFYSCFRQWVYLQDRVAAALSHCPASICALRRAARPLRTLLSLAI